MSVFEHGFWQLLVLSALVFASVAGTFAYKRLTARLPGGPGRWGAALMLGVSWSVLVASSLALFALYAPPWLQVVQGGVIAVLVGVRVAVNMVNATSHDASALGAATLVVEEAQA
jgi:hypothetical protein